MVGGVSVLIACVAVRLAVLPHAQGQETSIGGKLVGSCPGGMSCAQEKCLTLPDGRKSCCQCVSWDSNGMCKPLAWKGADGTEACPLDTHPVPDTSLVKCPPGKMCQLSKCKGDQEEETCCLCERWNDDGSCEDSSWSRVRGEGTCAVDPDDGSAYMTGQITVGAASSAVDVADAREEGAVTEDIKTESTTDTSMQQHPSAENFADSSQESFGNAAIAESNGSVTQPENTGISENGTSAGQQPHESVDITCPSGTECDGERCMGAGALQTCCSCGNYDESGKCLPGGWTVVSGIGTCDFTLINSHPGQTPVAFPNRGSASAEQFVDALPLPPCPEGTTCVTTKCAVTDGVEICCDCWVWRPDGYCASDGWLPRGRGDCAFATTSR